MVIALAGRRIDPPGAEIDRFPPQKIDKVTCELRSLFKTMAITALVSSAACGADLIAISEAGALGARRRVVLPFDPETFRKTSVADRPGDWGAIYDRVLEEVSLSGDLVILVESPDNPETYSMTTTAILDEAQRLAGCRAPVAVTVWDGHSRGADDLTAQFGTEARRRNLRVLQVTTV